LILKRGLMKYVEKQQSLREYIFNEGKKTNEKGWVLTTAAKGLLFAGSLKECDFQAQIVSRAITTTKIILRSKNRTSAVSLAGCEQSSAAS
jgi:hypothetical protein